MRKVSAYADLYSDKKTKPGVKYMKNEKTRALREGAMMVALTALLMLMNRFVPLFSVIGVFACGVPMAALAARNGFKIIVPAVTAVFFVAVLLGDGVVGAISTILVSVLPGAVAGYMLGRRKSFFYSIFATSLVVCLGWVFELVVIEFLIGKGIDEMFAETIEQTKAIMSGVTETLGEKLAQNSEVSPDTLMETLFEALEFTMRLYFPSIVVISSLFAGYIIVRISGFVIRRAKLASVAVLPFSHLRATRGMAVISVISYLLCMFVDVESSPGAVIANIVFIMHTILAVCGLSFIDFKLKGSIKSAPVRFLIYGAVMMFGGILMSIISNILIIIGILDSGRDYRGLGAYNGF